MNVLEMILKLSFTLSKCQTEIQFFWPTASYMQLPVQFMGCFVPKP